MLPRYYQGRASISEYVRIDTGKSHLAIGSAVQGQSDEAPVLLGRHRRRVGRSSSNAHHAATPTRRPSAQSPAGGPPSSGPSQRRVKHERHRTAPVPSPRPTDGRWVKGRRRRVWPRLVWLATGLTRQTEPRCWIDAVRLISSRFSCRNRPASRCLTSEFDLSRTSVNWRRWDWKSCWGLIALAGSNPVSSALTSPNASHLEPVVTGVPWEGPQLASLGVPLGSATDRPRRA